MSRVFSASVAIALSLAAVADAQPNALPYDEFVKFTEKLPAESVDGKPVVAAYLKSKDGTPKLDPAKANFRILLPDGTAVALKCEELPEKPEDAKTPADGKRILAGFTHKLWIPKDPVAYAGSALLNDLPAQSLEVQFPLPPREE